MFFRLKITQLTRTNPAAEPWGSWEKLKKSFSTIDEVKKELEEIYGKIPFRKGNEIYIDKKNGEPEHIGYHYSFWEYSCDRSLPPNHKYFATDWIEILKIQQQSAITEIN